MDLLIIAIILAIILILIFKEMKPIHKESRKLFWVYTVFLATAFVLWMLNGLDIKVPSFSDPLAKMLKAAFGIKD